MLCARSAAVVFPPSLTLALTLALTATFAITMAVTFLPAVALVRTMAAFPATLEVRLGDHAVVVAVGALQHAVLVFTLFFRGDPEAAVGIGTLEHVDHPVLVDRKPQRTEILKREGAVAVGVGQRKQFTAPGIEFLAAHLAVRIGVEHAQEHASRAAVTTTTHVVSALSHLRTTAPAMLTTAAALSTLTPLCSFAARATIIVVIVGHRATRTANTFNGSVAVTIQHVEHAVGEKIRFFLGYGAIAVTVEELKRPDHTVIEAGEKFGLEFLQIDLAVAICIGRCELLRPDFLDFSLGDDTVFIDIETFEQPLGAFLATSHAMTPAEAVSRTTAPIHKRNTLSVGLLNLLPPVLVCSRVLGGSGQAGRQRGTRDARSQGGNCNP